MQNLTMSARLLILLFASLLSATGCLTWEYDPVDFLEVETGAHDILASTTIAVEGRIGGLQETIVTQHGHCWATDNDRPTIETDPHTELGLRGGNGVFVSELKGLQTNQTYFVRAYAIWQDKIFYANSVEIQTGVGISTDSVQYLAGKRAIGFGRLDQQAGSDPVTDQGFVWSPQDINPTIADQRVSALEVEDSGYFYVKLDDLPIGATIFLRAYAVQDNLVLYGETISLISIPADIWVERSPFPGGFGWRDAVAFSLKGKGYIGTGIQGGIRRQDFWRYDPISNTWEAIRPFRGPGRSNAVALTIGDEAYVGTGDVGGHSGTIDFWVYDLEKDDWFRRQNFRGGPVRYATGFEVAGQGYLLNRIDNTLWRYDPQTVDWYPAAELPDFDNRYGATGFALQGNGVVTGGAAFSLNGSLFKDVWTYNPIENKWTRQDDFPGMARANAVGVSIEEAAYVGLGDDNSFEPFTDFWEYRNGTWTQRAAFGAGEVSSFSSFAIGDRVYVQAADGSFWVHIPE